MPYPSLVPRPAPVMHTQTQETPSHLIFLSFASVLRGASGNEASRTFLVGLLSSLPAVVPLLVLVLSQTLHLFLVVVMQQTFLLELDERVEHVVGKMVLHDAVINHDHA